MERQIEPRNSRRWRWCAIALLLVLALSTFDFGEPEWYTAESDAMERVSQLLDAPFPYRRNGSGWGRRRHVGTIVLPSVTVDREVARELAKLIIELPECHMVSCAFVLNQSAAIDALNDEFTGLLVATHDLGASSQTVEDMQRETYVAGIHRGSDYSAPQPPVRSASGS